MTEERRIELSVEVPGTPEEVWRTIATGEGIGSWFIPMEVEEAEGGAVTMDFGVFGKESARVTAWEPPTRVVFAGPEEGERSLAYEWLVEARDGGTCVVRLVNSGFGAGDDWDGDYDGMSRGWRVFLQNLRVQRTHFPGRRAVASIPSVLVPGGHDAAWATLCEALGVAPDLEPGARFETSGDDVPRLGATVEQTIFLPAATSCYLLAADDPVPANVIVLAEGDGDAVTGSVWQYLYEDGAAVDRRWTEFLTSRWPVPSVGQPG